MKLNLRTNILLLLLPVFLSAQKPVEYADKPAVDSVLQFVLELADLQPNDALALSQQIKNLALRHNDSLLLADALRLEGNSHFNLYNFQRASDLYNQAQGIYQQQKDSLGLAYTLAKLAQVDINLGAHYQALNKLEKALKLSRAIDNKRSQAEVLYFLARVHLDQKEFKVAHAEAIEALEITKSEHYRGLRGSLYTLIAKILLSREEPQKALDYLENSLLISRSLGGNKEIAEAYATSARVWHFMGNNRNALENIQQALEISEEYAFPYTYTEHLLIYSKILLENGETEEAVEVAERADSIANLRTKIETLNLKINKHLADTYLANRDSVKSLERLLQYKDIDDSLRNFNMSELLLLRNIEKGQSEKENLIKESDRKDQLIDRSKLLLLLAAGLIVVFVLLIAALINNVRRKKHYTRHILKKSKELSHNQEVVQEQRKELEAKNAELEKLDKSKNKIFSVLTHDLRQPISQIRSVLELLEVQDLSGAERAEIIGKLKESVDNSSNALENLLLWSKKQLTGISTRIVDVHLLPQIWQLESQLKPTLKNKDLSLDINVPDFFKVKADMNQLDICLRNLANNAIKFSNRGGKITISTSEDNQHKYIKIKDSGVGMDEEQLQKLKELQESFSTIGTMNEKGTGLGVLITHEFMENQNGKLLIESRKGEGSTFTLAFPKVNKDDSRGSHLAVS